MNNFYKLVFLLTSVLPLNICAQELLEKGGGKFETLDNQMNIEITSESIYELVIPNGDLLSSSLYKYVGSTLQVFASSKKFSKQDILKKAKSIDHPLRQIRQFDGWKLVLADLFDARVDENQHALGMMITQLSVEDAFKVDIYKLKNEIPREKRQSKNIIISIPLNTKYFGIQLHAFREKFC